MKKIVVLDGFTLNPGDLSWKGMEILGDLQVYDRTSESDILERAGNAEIVITNKTPLNKETIQRLPKMEYIGVLATGYNCVDVEAAAMRGIPVTNIPTYGTHSVAQFTFALLLELCHHVQVHSDAVHQGEWTQNPDFCFQRTAQIELQNKTMGIVGFGKIGQQVARIARVMGMKLSVFSRSKTTSDEWKDVRWVDRDTLMAESDVISLHCPQSPETEKFINEGSIKLMKKSALLLNTSRGGLIDEWALQKALNEEKIAGAALDVLSMEPPASDHPLYYTKNCIITPHIAWSTVEARTRLMEIAVHNLQQFLKGAPVNVVNGGYTNE